MRSKAPEPSALVRARTERGLSLVEATVILAVLSVLTAMVAPAVRTYVQEAQAAAAQSEAEAIAVALVRMLADMGESFVLRDGSETGSAFAHGAPSHASTGTPNHVELLVSAGDTPAVYGGVARGSGTDWDDAVDDAAIQDLDDHLVLNTPGNSAGNAYRTAAGMTGIFNFDGDDGATFNATYAWRGAYLPGPIGPDPWGNRYHVNVEFLVRPLGGPGGHVHDVFVLSAGNNDLIETAFETDGAASGNDVIAIVSGGTR